jgi:DNA-binding transcriptional LysR family regulator
MIDRQAWVLALALVAKPDLITGGPARETLPARIERIGLVGRPSICADAAEIWALPLRRNRSSTVLKLPASQRFAVNNHLVAREIALAGLSSALLIDHSVKNALSTRQLHLVDPRYT